MTAPSFQIEELRGLADAACDAALTDADAARLEELLRGRPDAQRFYLACIRLDGCLRWEFGHQAKVIPAQPLAPPSLSPLISLSPTNYPPPTTFVGGPVFSYMVATVLLCLMLLGGWAYKINRDRGMFAGNSQESTATGSINQSQMVVVGRITGTKDCRWSNPDTQTIVGASVMLDREYALASGLLEITYTSGAKVILEGPCVYKVESIAGGFLVQGKLTARINGAKPQAANPEPRNSSLIPHPSSLFAVRTPTAKITDLGTEFGVEVDNNGDTTSHVFKGSVLVRAIAENQSTASTGSVDVKTVEIVDLKVVLFEGKSVRVKCGKDGGNMQLQVDPAGWDPSSFVRAMPKSHLAGSSEAYADTVLSLHPAVYYRMEHPRAKQSDNMVSDSASGGSHGELRLGNEYGGTPYRSGRFGDSLWLRGPVVGDHAIVHDYPKAENDRLTVSAWVMATRRNGWAMIAANWGTPREGYEEIDNAGQFHIGLYRNDGDLCARIVQRNGEWIQVREGVPFPVGVWQHVALVVDRNIMRLYRNGEEVASTPCEGILPRPPVAALVIGCRLDETGKAAPSDTGGYHYWQGRIDELVVLNRALQIEAIRQLYYEKKVNGRTEAAVGKGESSIDGP